MKIIAAVDQNWAIGNKGQLLVSIPQDMKNFRNETIGKVVVLGRKTIETFPGGKPLKGRTNIILSRNPEYECPDAIVVRNVEELLEKVKEYNSEDVYVIGGESIYRQLLPYCDEAIITEIDLSYEADAFIPNLALAPDWEEVSRSEEQTYFDIEYYFVTYKRVAEDYEIVDEEE